MSGQPVQTEGDVDRFRNEYMQSLALQAQLEDMNLQANKIYLQTGQLPPQSQMTDTRTTAEKLKDIIGLKQTIVQELRPIAEPQFALNIVNSVEQSAMNIDGGFLRWFAQNTPEIVNNLTRKYKLGIAGDSNDVQVIISFLETMYADIKNSMKSVKSYINSSTSVSGRPDVLSQNDFNQLIKMVEESITVLSRTHLMTYRTVTYNFITDLKRLNSSILNTDELNNLREVIASPYITQSDDLTEFDIGLTDLSVNESSALYRKFEGKTDVSIGQLFALYCDIMEQMPKSRTVYLLLDKLNQAYKKQDNIYIQNIITELINLFSGILDTQNLGLIGETSVELKKLLSMINNYKSAVITNDTKEQANIRKIRRDLGIQQVLVVNDGPSQSIPVHEQYKGEIEIPQNMNDYVRSHKEFNNLTKLIPEDSEDIESLSSSILSSDSLHQLPEPKSTPQLDEYTRRFHQDTARIQEALRNKYYKRYSSADKNEQEILENVMYRDTSIMSNPPSLFDFRKNYIYPAMGIKGKGIRKGRPRGGSIVPVPKKPAFVGFGINEIDQLKLDKNILSIRRNTRSKIKGMGNKHISEPMKRIIKNFIGGSVPNYNDLSSLDNEEKEYLNKIVEHSDLKDRLSVPAPSKDQREKDFHSFEVMKGEILAGNDSKELIKKFKLLMIKLSRQNLLPKSEVQELMEELVELGY